MSVGDAVSGRFCLPAGPGLSRGSQATARDWSRSVSPKVVTLDVASMSEHELRKELIELRKRNATLLAVLRLVVVLLKVCEVSLVRRRLPSDKKKRALLRAVDRSKTALESQRL